MKKYTLLLSLIICALPQTWATQPFEIKRWQTKNGARVIFYQAMEVPMLDISIAFAAGSAYDEEKFGLSALTTRLLNQGNGGLSADVISEKIAETGAQYEKINNQDMVIFNLKTLTDAENLKKASDIFSLIINHPDFPIESFNREKNQQLMTIKQTQESPDQVANQIFFQALYKNHPYAHPVIGNHNSVAQLKPEHVHSFYQRFFVSRNAVIVLVGAIDKSAAEKLAEKITQDLPKGAPAPEISPAQPLTEEINIEVPFPSSQTILRLGQLGITHHDKHYFPLLVGNYMLGGGTLVSILSDELREKRGLTYGVYSQFAPMLGKGPFLISLSTQNSQAKTAIELTRETVNTFINTKPHEAAILAAKQYLTGSFPLSLASNRSIADILLKIAFYHLPDDYLQTYIERINSVTAEQIQESFNQLITPNKLIELSVGKA